MSALPQETIDRETGTAVSAESTPSIKVSGITKTYNVYSQPSDRLLRRFGWQRGHVHQVHALKDISFEVHPGETLGIVGRNGSGKSTLLEIIVGTLAADLGTVSVAGRISALLELGAGFDPEFTGRENLYLNAHLMGFSREEIETRLDDILAFAELGDFIDQPVKTYSSGMFVRLAFSVAINVDPEVLIVDEALAVGDAAFQRKCFARIEKMNRDGTTILFVSHSDRTVIELCDRAILLHEGNLLLTGTPRDVISVYHRILFDPDWAGKAHDLAAFRALLEADVPADRNKPLATTRASATHFNPELVPSTRFEYEPKGARLRDPMILDEEGRQVNLLLHGERYTYTYEVEFTEDALSVRCGMLIKTVSGLELSACGTSSQRKAIGFVPAGSTLTIAFDFTCGLLPEYYFLNCGVSSVVDGSRQFLHRIVDALMIQVLPETDILAGHHVDLGYKPRVTLRAPDGKTRQVVRNGIPMD